MVRQLGLYVYDPYHNDVIAIINMVSEKTGIVIYSERSLNIGAKVYFSADRITTELTFIESSREDAIVLWRDHAKNN